MPSLDLPAGHSTLLVWRKDLRCEFRLLDDREAEGLRLMQAGGTFHDLCEALVRSAGDEEGVMLSGTFLGRWISDGLVRLDSRALHSVKTAAIFPAQSARRSCRD